MFQIIRSSTGEALSVDFYGDEIIDRLIELIAHVTGISVDDLEVAYLYV